MALNLNIKNNERFLANVRHLCNLFILFLKFRKVFKNFIHVFKGYLLNYEKIEAILNNNQKYNLTPRFCYSLAMLNDENIEIDLKNDVVDLKYSLNSKNCKITIHNGLSNGDIYHVFLRNEYSVLNVKGRVVLDIGANIGDSSIYFCLNGAKNVIGLEPFPMNQKIALTNIEKNNLEEKCKVVLAGCGKSQNIQLENNFKSDVDSVLQNQKSGQVVSIYSLEQIVEKFKIPNNSVLKIDCEGCEYEAILNSPQWVLKKFDQILIEYHNGYLDLKRKLEESGFVISVKGPESTGFIGKYIKKISNKNKKRRYCEKITCEQLYGYVGLIFAKQIENYLQDRSL